MAKSKVKVTQWSLIIGLQKTCTVHALVNHDCVNSMQTYRLGHMGLYVAITIYNLHVQDI